VLGLASLILAAASANVSPVLTSASPWWEKVTYTISGGDARQACVYESSFAGARSCDGDEQSSPVHAADSPAGAYTKITIERRFTPSGGPDPLSLQPGDTLLGGQVMALAIDATGAVRGCKILAASGDVRPAYGCREARAERFGVNAREAAQVRQGLMAILVYGHEESLA
jgi:hypothetical protein